MEKPPEGPDPAPGLAEALDSLDTVCLRCDAEGRVLAMNGAATRLLGFGQGGREEQPCLPALLPDPADWDHVKTRHAAQGAPGGHRTSLRTADGSRVPCSLDVLELAGGDGDAAGYYIFLRRTEPAEERVRDLEETVERARRMAHLQDRLVNALAHDLKTPPVVMMGFSELLLRGRYGPLAPEQEKPLRTIHRNVSALVDMVERVLVFSRLIVSLPGEREPLALRGLWTSTLARIGEEDGSIPGRFTPEPADDVDDLPCHREGLAFVLETVAWNALCMMEGSSAATWRTLLRPGQLELHVDLPATKPDLPPLPRLLDGLFCDVKHGASGEVVRRLGLAPARYVAEALGGDLEARPLSPGGARLLLSLPRP